MNTIRCSALPLVWQCPESQNRPEGEALVNESSEPAECGTAFHRWIAAHINDTDLDTAKLAAEHGCDPDELSMLTHMGRKAWSELSKYFDAADAPPMVEVPLQTGSYCSTQLVGTADVIARQGSIALILDWKTGRVDSDYTHQTRGYAYAGIDHLVGEVGGIDEVVVITVWVRQGIWDVEKLTPGEVASWAMELRRRLTNGRGNFNPGGHCQYCPRRLSCPGRLGLVRATLASLTVEGAPVVPWTPETRNEMGPQIGEMLRRIKLVEGVCDDFKTALRTDIGLYGPMPVGEGRQLALVPTNRRKLDSEKAWPILKSHMEERDIRAASNISLAECERVVAEWAGKGKGADAKRKLSADLEQADAISITTSHSLKEQRAPITQEASS